MKLVEDDGEVIQDIGDDTALILLMPNKETGAVFQKMGGDVDVPQHMKLAAALLVFLKDEANVKEVMRYLPRKRAYGYKAN